MIKPSLRFSIYRKPDIFNLYIFLHYFVKKKWLSAVLYVHSDFFFFLIFCCLPKNVRVPYTDIYFRLHETFYNDGSWSTQSTNSLWCQNGFPSSAKVSKKDLPKNWSTLLPSRVHFLSESPYQAHKNVLVIKMLTQQKNTITIFRKLDTIQLFGLFSVFAYVID